MNIFAFLLFAALVLCVYFLAGIVVRFYKRLRLIKGYKRKMNDLIEGRNNDGSGIS